MFGKFYYLAIWTPISVSLAIKMSACITLWLLRYRTVLRRFVYLLLYIQKFQKLYFRDEYVSLFV